MRAMCVTGPGQATIRDVADLTPDAGQVLVRIGACGVCASDLNAWRGVAGVEYPLAAGSPGHEAWGTIVALGDGLDRHPLAVGDTVTGLMWNGFAEFCLADAEHLIALPPDLTAAPFLGEPLACAINVVRRAAVRPGDRLAIVGFGYLAALIVQVLPRDHGGWIAIARRADSRALALSLGAEAVFDFADVPAHLWDSFPIVVEASGVQPTLDYATWLTGYGGRLVIAGYHADGPRVVNMQTWNWKGIDVVNAHERQAAVYLSALRAGLDLVSTRALNLGGLITHVFALDEAADAFAIGQTRPAGFVKAIVRP